MGRSIHPVVVIELIDHCDDRLVGRSPVVLRVPLTEEHRCRSQRGRSQGCSDLPGGVLAHVLNDTTTDPILLRNRSRNSDAVSLVGELKTHPDMVKYFGCEESDPGDQ